MLLSISTLTKSYSNRTINCPYEVTWHWEWGNSPWSKSLRGIHYNSCHERRLQDHLYTLLDQCIDEDILQQIRKKIRAVLSLVEVNIIGSLSRFNRISNEPANKTLSPQKLFFSIRKHHKNLSTKIARQTNKQKHDLKQSLLLKLQSLNQL